MFFHCIFLGKKAKVQYLRKVKFSLLMQQRTKIVQDSMVKIQTGINHKGLQRTADEYAERRIYKDTFIAFESKGFS